MACQTPITSTIWPMAARAKLEKRTNCSILTMLHGVRANAHFKFSSARFVEILKLKIEKSSRSIHSIPTISTNIYLVTLPHWSRSKFKLTTSFCVTLLPLKWFAMGAISSIQTLPAKRISVVAVKSWAVIINRCAPFQLDQVIT